MVVSVQRGQAARWSEDVAIFQSKSTSKRDASGAPVLVFAGHMAMKLGLVGGLGFAAVETGTTEW
jgi:hypothetical protein